MSQPSRSADVILDFVSWLKQKRASTANALWFCHSNLYKETIWEMGDCGGYQMVCDSLFETVERESGCVPASRANQVVFYAEEALPLTRPTAFESVTAAYPLAGTGAFQCCATTVSVGQQKMTCSRCNGEGSVFVYKKMVFHWNHDCDREFVLTEQISRREVRALVNETVAEGDAIPLESFDPEEVIAKLGYGDKNVPHFAEKAKEMSEHYAGGLDRGLLLRQEQRWSYVPLTYLNVHLGTKFGQFFSSGRGKAGNILPPSQAWCPWRVSFWYSLMALLVAIMVQFNDPEGALSRFWLLAPALLLPMAIWSFLADRRLTDSPLWLIHDDGDGAGWRFSAQLTKYWALEQVAKIEDPYYTVLFAEDQSERRGRSSFDCRLSEMGTPVPRRLELLYVRPQVEDHSCEKVVELSSQAEALIWVSRKPADELDREIAARLEQVGQHAVLEVYVIGEGDGYQRELFGRTQGQLGARPFHLLALSQMDTTFDCLTQALRRSPTPSSSH